MSRQAEHSSPVKSLPGARLDRAGADQFNGAMWSTRLTMAALAISAGWVLVTVFRPLPAPERSERPVPPALATQLDNEPTLAMREALLAKLAADGNIFAFNRKAWKTTVASHTNKPNSKSLNDSKGKAAGQRVNTPASSATSAVVAKTVRYDDIPIEKKPAVGVGKELADLRLRGVYRNAGVPVALIGNIRQPNRARSQPHRVGDIFGKVEWKVLAIDDAGKRVILTLSGVNVELRMYDEKNLLAQVGKKKAQTTAQPTNPSVVVHTRTVDQIRSDLAQAGLSNAQIDELLSLSKASAVANATGDKPAPAAAPPVTQAHSSLKGAPAGIAELLKMMTSTTAPGAVAPTLPTIKPSPTVKPKEAPTPKKGG